MYFRIMFVTKDYNIANIAFRLFIPLMKLLLIIGIVLLIYFQVFRREDLGALFSSFIESFSNSNILLLLACLALLPLNWIIEAVKWRSIVQEFKEISIQESLKMVLGGLTFGLLTPSRIGEYGGRFYMMSKKHRWKTISATFIDSISQNIVTAIFGLFGAAYLLVYTPVMNTYIASSIFYISSVAIVLGLIIYYRIGYLQFLVRFLPSKWATICDLHSRFLRLIPSDRLTLILIYSLMRYIIYATQYILLLHFFGIAVPIFEAYATVALIYLVQTSLPFPPIIDVLARGEIALTIWTLYSNNSIGILATALGIWVINLIAPALIGLFYVIVHKD